MLTLLRTLSHVSRSSTRNFLLPSSFGDGLGDGPSWQFAIWSNSDPNVIYAVSNGWRKRLLSYNVVSGTWSPLKSFMEHEEVVEQAEGGILFHMTMSEDEDTFAFYERKGGENPQAIVWRRSTDTVMRFPTTGIEQTGTFKFLLNVEALP